MNSELEEILDPRNGLLFCEEELSPVFCKPKIIPLKSVTIEKLERMQSEAMEIMKKMEESKDKTPTRKSTDMQYNPSKSERSTVDVWIAEENQETATKTAS